MPKSNGKLDLRRAINAVSDVIQNRPQPLREFDQIYMKAGDMVLQTSLIAQRFAGRNHVAASADRPIMGCPARFPHWQVSSMHGVGRLRCSPICDFEWQLRVADFRAVEVPVGRKLTASRPNANGSSQPSATTEHMQCGQHLPVPIWRKQTDIVNFRATL